MPDVSRRETARRNGCARPLPFAVCGLYPHAQCVVEKNGPLDGERSDLNAARRRTLAHAQDEAIQVADGAINARAEDGTNGAGEPPQGTGYNYRSALFRRTRLWRVRVERHQARRRYG